MSTPVTALKIGKYYFDFNQMIGKGNTGNVFQGTNTQTQQQIAVKAIQMNQIQGEVTQYLLQSQKKALNTIKSPYIIKTLDVIQLKDQCLIVTQFCGKGSLKDYIANKEKLSNIQAIQLFRKILIGYIAISEALFIHRDLKTANILLRNNGEPVIIDFGYSQMMMAKRPMIQYNVGSPSYMAPQVYAKSRYSQKSDVWSLGVILHEMLTGKTLDHGYTDMHDFFRTLQKQGKPRINTEGMSQVCKDLLDMALQVQPQKRGTSHKLKYLIDKSLIPQMQSQLNSFLGSKLHRHHQDESRVRKFIPSTHFNYETPKSQHQSQNNNQFFKAASSQKQIKINQKPSLMALNSPTFKKQQVFKTNPFINSGTHRILTQPTQSTHSHSNLTFYPQNCQIPSQKYIPNQRLSAQFPTKISNNYKIQQQQKINYIHVPNFTNFNSQFVIKSPQNFKNTTSIRIK